MFSRNAREQDLWLGVVSEAWAIGLAKLWLHAVTDSSILSLLHRLLDLFLLHHILFLRRRGKHRDGERMRPRPPGEAEVKRQPRERYFAEKKGEAEKDTKIPRKVHTPNRHIHLFYSTALIRWAKGRSVIILSQWGFLSSRWSLHRDFSLPLTYLSTLWLDLLLYCPSGVSVVVYKSLVCFLE